MINNVICHVQNEILQLIALIRSNTLDKGTLQIEEEKSTELSSFRVYSQ